MSRVANKNGILAATRYCAAADCGSGEVASSPHRRFAYREPMPTARRATLVAATTRYWRSQPFAGVAARCHSRTRRFAHRVMAAVILRCQGAQHSERPFLSQPARELASRAVCYVRLLAKGITIRVVAFLAMPSRHVTAQQPIAGARAGRPSRTKCYAPPCPACNPTKPNSRPCGT